MQIAAITLQAAPLRRATSASKTRSRAEEDAERNRVRCAACNLRDLCLPSGIEDEDMAAFSDSAFTRKRVKRGDTLYHSGEAFNAIFAVRAGFFKSSVVLEDGRDQVTGFHMAGEIVGMDGIGTERHASDVRVGANREVRPRQHRAQVAVGRRPARMDPGRLPGAPRSHLGRLHLVHQRQRGRQPPPRLRPANRHPGDR